MDSYLGYMENEEVSVQLPFILVHKKMTPKIHFSSVTILSDGKNIADGISDQTIETEEKDYSICKLEISLHSLKPGIYTFNDIMISTDQNEELPYNVGDWTVEIRAGSTPEDLEIKQVGSLFGFFERYTIELKNTSQNSIYVSGMHAQLKRHPFTENVLLGSDYEGAIMNPSTDQALKSGASKGINLDFDTDVDLQDIKNNFVCFKPFLRYTINEEEKYMPLPLANYSPSIEAEEAKDIVFSMSNADN